jgi:hypothetical protein
MPKLGRLKFWNEERLDVIRQHAKTHSAAEIAALFKGISRNAIIGVAGREGIKLAKIRVYHPLKNPVKRHRVKQEAKMGNKDSGSSETKLKRPRPVVAAPPAPRTHVSIGIDRAKLGKPDHDLEDAPCEVYQSEAHAEGELTLWNLGPNQCHWPTGHNGSLTTYCGAPTENTYCPFHTRVRGGT